MYTFFIKKNQIVDLLCLLMPQVLQPSSKEKYPAFTFMKGHRKDYELSVAAEKREWPFIRDTGKAGTTSGDFVLLWLFKTETQHQVIHHKSGLDQSVFTLWV